MQSTHSNRMPLAAVHENKSSAAASQGYNPSSFAPTHQSRPRRRSSWCPRAGAGRTARTPPPVSPCGPARASSASPAWEQAERKKATPCKVLPKVLHLNGLRSSSCSFCQACSENGGQCKDQHSASRRGPCTKCVANGDMGQGYAHMSSLFAGLVCSCGHLQLQHCNQSRCAPNAPTPIQQQASFLQLLQQAHLLVCVVRLVVAVPAPPLLVAARWVREPNGHGRANVRALPCCIHLA